MAVDIGADPGGRYQRLVDHSPDAICVHEAGRVVYVNPAGLSWIGAAGPGQVVGHLITDFVHPDSIPAMVERIAGLTREGESSEPSEALMLRLDGTELLVEAVSVRTVWEGRPAFEVIFRDLTAQRVADAALRFQAALVEHVSDAIIATTFDGVVTSWNPAAVGIYERTVAEAIGTQVSDAVGAQLHPAAVVASGGVTSAEHRASDGSVRRIRVSVAPMDDGFVLICSDQTALSRAEEHFRTVVTSLDEGIIVIGRRTGLESVNPSALRILGVTEDALRTMDRHTGFDYPLFDMDGRRLTRDEHPVMRAFATGKPHPGFVLSATRPDGSTVWLSGRCTLLNGSDPDGASAVLSFADITVERNAAAELEYQATHDALTGLPNRMHVVAAIGDRVTGGASAGTSAVLFIDLDKLKMINDSFGHAAGDRVLEIVGERLRRAVRRDDVVGRLGGDEFVALLRGDIDRAAVDGLAERLHAALRAPVDLDGTALALDASIGAVVFGDGDTRTPEDILRQADEAMYDAKLAGGGCTRHYADRSRIRTPRPLVSDPGTALH